ncbi:hypothetical protein [Burkholderia sp. RS02]
MLVHEAPPALDAKPTAVAGCPGPLSAENLPPRDHSIAAACNFPFSNEII